MKYLVHLTQIFAKARQLFLINADQILPYFSNTQMQKIEVLIKCLRNVLFIIYLRAFIRHKLAVHLRAACCHKIAFLKISYCTMDCV